MAGLLEKMKSLPQGNKVYLDEVLEGGHEEETAHEEQKPEPKAAPETKPDRVGEADDGAGDAAKTVKNDDAEAAKRDSEDKEPPRNAPKAVKDAYKERKLKEADAEKLAAKTEAAQLRKDLEAAQKEKDDWKKQAETVASRPAAPREEPKVAPKADTTLPDITKDPVGHLSQALALVNERYASLEARETTARAFRELDDVEAAYTKTNPEHTEVMKFGEDESVKRNMMLNPNANEAQLRANFKASKLDTVVKLMRGGLTEQAAVAKVHEMTKVIFGYQPKAAPAAEPTTAEAKAAAEKARFAAVTKNKAKSATGLTAGGSSADADRIGNAKTNPLPLKVIAKMSKAQKDAYYKED